MEQFPSDVDFQSYSSEALSALFQNMPEIYTQETHPSKGTTVCASAPIDALFTPLEVNSNLTRINSYLHTVSYVFNLKRNSITIVMPFLN